MFAIVGAFFQKCFVIQVKLITKSMFIKFGVCRCLIELCFFPFGQKVGIFPKDKRPGLALVNLVFLYVIHSDA